MEGSVLMALVFSYKDMLEKAKAIETLPSIIEKNSTDSPWIE